MFSLSLSLSASRTPKVLNNPAIMNFNFLRDVQRLNSTPSWIVDAISFQSLISLNQRVYSLIQFLARFLHFLFAHPVEVSFDSEISVGEKDFHIGPISEIDLFGNNGVECASVGEDGRVNLVSLDGDSKASYRQVFDS
ncbi:hypothetical protein GIB67_017336 [Kingdonia uniflora]|uniref:Uncharacterized protein n=1 Tax=Kingdonia uniflora TaxID=39325 RepID=A0A7J7N6B9_9MAGN|nr:hypothetical protein GIB67_017336 [Kingdonia uniflora]